MSRPMRTASYIAVALGLAALVSACGQSSSNPGITHAARQSKASAQPSGKSAKGIDPDMVSAVNVNGTSSALFTMKFKLGSKPVVTTPVQVTVLMIPAPEAGISHLHVSFPPGDGLQLQSEHNVDLTDLSPDTPIEQQVIVVPQQSGVLNLNATVLVDTATESISRTYAIPLIAGDGHS
jgi:hypothetical protein